MNLKIMPQPKNAELEPVANLDSGISDIEIQDCFDERVATFAASLKDEKGLKLTARKDASLGRNGEYKIEFADEKITLFAGCDEGAYWGLRTLGIMKRKGQLNVRGFIHDWADLKMRIQHVDLKRLGWNFDYLLGLVEMFADLKINYIILEYEDKFKFDFCDKIPVDSAFTKEQIATLEKKARDNFIKIIPLVQCIGHFEYILRHDKYLELSENPKVRSQACPLHPGTFELFKKMASEIMEMHPYSEYFHVGADEPFLLGTCPKCAAEAEKSGKGKLYGDFLNKILSWVIDEKGKIPLFWADILEHYDDAAEMCRKDSIAVEWNYQPQTSRAKEIKFYQTGTGKMNSEIFESGFTEKQHERYDKYLDFNPETEDFDTLPFFGYLKDLGFEVIGGSNVKFADNVLTHSIKAMETGILGNFATYWASANTVRPPYAIFENRLQGVCMLAASAWNLDYEKANRDNFFDRTAEYLSGDEKYAPVYDVLNETGHVISPNDNNRNGDNYFANLDKALSLDIPENDTRLKTLVNFLKKIKLEKELEAFKLECLNSPLFTEDCYNTIDLSTHCNERFANTEEIPGWTRIYQNDLRFFPKGKQCFNGILFDVKEDGPNASDKSAVLVGCHDTLTFFPEKIEGLKIGTKAHALNFLHGHIEGNALSNGYYGKYVLTYEDGEKEEIPLCYRKEMGEWWRIVEIEEASIAWCGENLKRANVGLHIYSYFPKRPDKEIATLDFICESKTVLALAALTASIPPEDKSESLKVLTQGLRGFKEKLAEIEKESKELLMHYLSRDGMEDVANIAFEFTAKYIARMLKLTGVSG